MSGSVKLLPIPVNRNDEGGKGGQRESGAQYSYRTIPMARNRQRQKHQNRQQKEELANEAGACRTEKG